jgi:hypothetical protein
MTKQRVKMTSFFAQCASKHPIWYFAFGATKHVIGDVNTLTCMKMRLKTMSVKFVGGHSHLVEGIGDVFVSCDGKMKQIHDVFYVLGITKNLLSIRAIIDKGCFVIFGMFRCWVVSSQSIPPRHWRKEWGIKEVVCINSS